VTLLTGARVTDVTRAGDGLRIVTTDFDLPARRVVLATGGRSLPKSGSDGVGFEIAKRLGHTMVPTTPGLVPLVLEDGRDAMHRRLSGVAHEAELTLWVNDAVDIRLTGSLLWTHFGISGPLALDMSRHSIRNPGSTLTISFCPGQTFEDLEQWWMARATERPQASATTVLSTLLPASVADTLVERTGIDGAATLAHLSRADRRRLSHALVKWPLAVKGDRGYNYAEVTAGGISLDEIDPATMQSRVCPALFLVGEILDVDGRIGGFNFQWAWSSARVAAGALGT
jgi:predicted Rossmann fold flavoprotein